MVQAMRQMFGNPTLPITTHTWPLDHAEVAAFLYCALHPRDRGAGIMRRYRARTAD